MTKPTAGKVKGKYLNAVQIKQQVASWLGQVSIIKKNRIATNEIITIFNIYLEKKKQTIMNKFVSRSFFFLLQNDKLFLRLDRRRIKILRTRFRTALSRQKSHEDSSLIVKQIARSLIDRFIFWVFTTLPQHSYMGMSTIRILFYVLFAKQHAEGVIHLWPIMKYFFFVSERQRNLASRVEGSIFHLFNLEINNMSLKNVNFMLFF